MNKLAEHYDKIEIGYMQSWDAVERAGAGVTIGWQCDHIGFGMLTFSAKDGELKIDDEAMSPEFVVAVLKAVAKDYPDMPHLDK